MAIKTALKPTLCVDFDGVIHSYEDGWKKGEIYGTVIPGFFDWAEEATRHFEIAVYSSRSKDPILRKRMIMWIYDKYKAWWTVTKGGDCPAHINFTFPILKPTAWLTIDDRAVRFDGKWDAPELSMASLKSFRAWMKRK